MDTSSIGGEADIAETMAEVIEEEHLDATQASDLRSLWEAKEASLAKE
jgi:hypothetical protein